MKIRIAAILTLSMLALASCALDKKRIDYKVVSAQVPTLEMPPNLTAPASNEQYAIPGGEDALVASYSDYSKGIAARPTQETVLPELKNVRLERDATRHWLVVGDKAENVWPAVKGFWLEMGFQMQVDNPQAGVMETNWLENHGNAPKNYVRGVLGNGKALDSLQPLGERDQYITRLERGKDGLSTEVYISQQVMREAQGSNKRNFKWLPHANDREIEIAILQMMMARLGGGTTAATPNNTTAAAGTAAAVPATASVQLKDTPDGKVIQLNEPFDKSWRKVGLALDKARIPVEDKDRVGGFYLLRAITAAKGKKNGNYQVAVRESGAGCEVSVRNADGKSDPESLRIVEVLHQNIEK